LFAERFILPGLEKFNANSKGLGIAIECSHTRARLDAFECDVAIRLAARPDGDFACTPLLEVEAIVVASSKRVAGAARALPLLQGPLLAITHLRRAWHDAANFWNIELPEDVATVWFDSLETIVRQAEAGAGIALVPSILVATQLQEGRLERVPGLSAVPGPTYWWMTRKDMMADKDIKAFKKWVLQRLATVG
jgi:LysR family glycine cleavage system transcriptional activator